jgi:hypothetical protein
MSLGIAPKTGLTKQRIHGRQSDFPKICAAVAKMKSRGCTQTHPYPGAVVATHLQIHQVVR